MPAIPAPSASTTASAAVPTEEVPKPCPADYDFTEEQGCKAKILSPPALPKPAQEKIGRGPRMRWIPAGTFTMGALDGAKDETLSNGELPRYKMDAFWLDETEVTVTQYAACVKAGSCSEPDTREHCNWAEGDRGSHPVNCVDWNQATQFCTWANKALPSEVHWEYAARGKDERKYPWGNSEPADQLCWSGAGNPFGEGKRPSTCPVKSYGATQFGLYDMGGNVWEWTSSRWCTDLDTGCLADALVSRGGAWHMNNPFYMRPSARGRNLASFRVAYLGFRCARAAG